MSGTGYILNATPRGRTSARAAAACLDRRASRRVASSACRGEKDTKLAQKLGQLQPFMAVFPRECTGRPPSFGGQPNSFLARHAEAASFMTAAGPLRGRGARCEGGGGRTNTRGRAGGGSDLRQAVRAQLAVRAAVQQERRDVCHPAAPPPPRADGLALGGAPTASLAFTGLTHNFSVDPAV
jgi:hypothetical protein